MHKADSQKTPATTTHPPTIKPVLDGLYTWDVLYNGALGDSLFKSPYAARWALRRYRAELVAGEAIAIHAGQMLVDPDRCRKVFKDVALTNAQRTLRLPGKADGS